MTCVTVESVSVTYGSSSVSYTGGSVSVSNTTVTYKLWYNDSSKNETTTNKPSGISTSLSYSKTGDGSIDSTTGKVTFVANESTSSTKTASATCTATISGTLACDPKSKTSDVVKIFAEKFYPTLSDSINVWSSLNSYL